MLKKHLLLLLAVSVSAASIAGCRGSSAASNSNASANQPQIIDVTTKQAVVKQIPTYFEATGSLASDAQTDVAPAVGGKITAVNFDVGSYVEKGSVMVRLDDRDARIRLEQAEAQAEQSRRAVDQAVAGLNQAKVRLGLREGETFTVDRFPAVRTVKANLELAEQELKRTQHLFDSGDVSRSALDQRRSQRDALVGQLDDARASAAVAYRAITSAEAQVASARSAVTASETQVDAAKKAIADTYVYAPISGYISERVADPGEFISPSAPNAKIATILRTSTLRMKIDVPEQSVGKVAAGQGISLQVSAYPDRSFAGTVARIAPNLNAQARTLSVEADVANGEGLLKPGQFATVRLTQPKPESAVMVPASAVKAEGDINKVYVIKDGVAREILVQVGLLENDLIQVKQGVAEGDMIATSNINSLFDGVQVRQAN